MDISWLLFIFLLLFPLEPHQILHVCMGLKSGDADDQYCVLTQPIKKPLLCKFMFVPIYSIREYNRNVTFVTIFSSAILRNVLSSFWFSECFITRWPVAQHTVLLAAVVLRPCRPPVCGRWCKGVRSGMDRSSSCFLLHRQWSYSRLA